MQKNLNQIGSEARDLRAAYADSRVIIESYFGKPTSGALRDANSKHRLKTTASDLVDFLKQSINPTENPIVNHALNKESEILKTSTDHFRVNTEAYHDLAVVEAHLGGVAVNVQQPIELGHKV